MTRNLQKDLHQLNLISFPCYLLCTTGCEKNTSYVLTCPALAGMRESMSSGIQLPLFYADEGAAE